LSESLQKASVIAAFKKNQPGYCGGKGFGRHSYQFKYCYKYIVCALNIKLQLGFFNTNVRFLTSRNETKLKKNNQNRTSRTPVNQPIRSINYN
jgi:hypothetical protein